MDLSGHHDLALTGHAYTLDGVGGTHHFDMRLARTTHAMTLFGDETWSFQKPFRPEVGRHSSAGRTRKGIFHRAGRGEQEAGVSIACIGRAFQNDPERFHRRIFRLPQMQAEPGECVNIQLKCFYRGAVFQHRNAERQPCRYDLRLTNDIR